MWLHSISDKYRPRQSITHACTHTIMYKYIWHQYPSAFKKWSINQFDEMVLVPKSQAIIILIASTSPFIHPLGLRLCLVSDQIQWWGVTSMEGMVLSLAPSSFITFHGFLIVKIFSGCTTVGKKSKKEN